MCRNTKMMFVFDLTSFWRTHLVNHFESVCVSCSSGQKFPTWSTTAFIRYELLFPEASNNVTCTTAMSPDLSHALLTEELFTTMLQSGCFICTTITKDNARNSCVEHLCFQKISWKLSRKCMGWILPRNPKKNKF